jgi:hypothetical protein
MIESEGCLVPAGSISKQRAHLCPFSKAPAKNKLQGFMRTLFAKMGRTYVMLEDTIIRVARARSLAARSQGTESIEGRSGDEQTERLLKDEDFAGSIETVAKGRGRHIPSHAKLDALRNRVVKGGDEEGRSAGGGAVPASAAEQETRLE